MNGDWKDIFCGRLAGFMVVSDGMLKVIGQFPTANHLGAQSGVIDETNDLESHRRVFPTRLGHSYLRAQHLYGERQFSISHSKPAW
jgi:hypothetical protein